MFPPEGVIPRCESKVGVVIQKVLNALPVHHCYILLIPRMVAMWQKIGQWRYPDIIKVEERTRNNGTSYFQTNGQLSNNF